MHAIEFLVFLSILAGSLLALLLGRRVGRRVAQRFPSDEKIPGAEHVGMLQGAMLALLGLLLGFSFSGASSRFAERQELAVREANAMGTTFLRFDLLQDAARNDLRAALREYATLRVGLASADPSEAARYNSQLEQQQTRLWSRAIEAVKAEPALTMPLLIPLNEMFDLHAERKAAAERHLPAEVLVVLGLSAFTTLFVVGFGAVLGKDRFPIFSVSLALLIAMALWATIDLDYPRRGLIRLLSAQPLIDAVQAMQPK